MHNHNSRFTFGDIVFLKTDPDQLGRIVTDIRFSPGNQVVYGVNYETQHSEHYDIELSEDRDMQLVLGLKNENHSN